MELYFFSIFVLALSFLRVRFIRRLRSGRHLVHFFKQAISFRRVCALTQPVIINRYCHKKPQRPPGGGRPLLNPQDVFLYNDWDNVSWDDEQEASAREKVAANSLSPVPQIKQEQYEREADKFWDTFYNQHQNRFFKDRHWLFTEFPELETSAAQQKTGESSQQSEEDKHSSLTERTEAGLTYTETDSVSLPNEYVADYSLDNSSAVGYPGSGAKRRFFEVGCGVGNTVFPVLKTNNDAGLYMYCCDLSYTAIQLVKEHDEYREDRCHAFVADVSDPDVTLPFPEESLDVIILIFVMSAIHPDKMQDTISCLARHLKPGGIILFRDYGRYDLAQLRFKNGQCLSDNFYVRGDGTRVYFFTQEELRDMFTNAGLVEQQNLIDRRLQVNRGRQLKMYRVWIQCKYSKPS